jgi:ribosomal protein L40E
MFEVCCLITIIVIAIVIASWLIPKQKVEVVQTEKVERVYVVKCSRCGTTNDADSTYCKKCGVKL